MGLSGGPEAPFPLVECECVRACVRPFSPPLVWWRWRCVVVRRWRHFPLPLLLLLLVPPAPFLWLRSFAHQLPKKPKGKWKWEVEAAAAAREKERDRGECVGPRSVSASLGECSWPWPPLPRPPSSSSSSSSVPGHKGKGLRREERTSAAPAGATQRPSTRGGSPSVRPSGRRAGPGESGGPTGRGGGEGGSGLSAALEGPSLLLLSGGRCRRGRKTVSARSMSPEGSPGCPGAGGQPGGRQ